MGNCLRKKDKKQPDGNLEDGEKNAATGDGSGEAFSRIDDQEQPESVWASTTHTAVNKEEPTAASAQEINKGSASTLASKVALPKSGGGGPCEPSRFRVVDRCNDAPMTLGRFSTARACSTPTSPFMVNKFGVAQGYNNYYDRGGGAACPSIYQDICPSTTKYLSCYNSCSPCAPPVKNNCITMPQDICPSTTKYLNCYNSCTPQLNANCMTTQQNTCCPSPPTYPCYNSCMPQETCPTTSSCYNSDTYFDQRLCQPGRTMATGAGRFGSYRSMQTPCTPTNQSSSYFGSGRTKGNSPNRKNKPKGKRSNSTTRSNASNRSKKRKQGGGGKRKKGKR